MNRILLALLAASVVYIGCRKEGTTPISVSTCDTVRECVKMPALLKFTGFSTADLDTVIFRKYSYDNDFTTQLSEEIKLFTVEELNDDAPLKLMINDSFDYVIEVPATDKKYLIHSAPIPLILDTFKCGEITQYSPPCASYAPYIMVNAQKADMGVEHLGSGTYRGYIILMK